MQIISEYKKQLSRIKRFIRRAEKRGYKFPENAIPKKPKNISEKSVNALKNITPEKLYKKATHESGIKGLEQRKHERKIAAKKGAETKKARRKYSEISGFSIAPEGDTGRPKEVTKTLDYVLEQIRTWTPQSGWSDWFSDQKRQDKNLLERMLQGAINTEGEIVVADRLSLNAEEVNRIVANILYGSGGGDYRSGQSGRDNINFDFARFSAIIIGRPLTTDESIALSDLFESNESYE